MERDGKREREREKEMVINTEVDGEYASGLVL
jgi:hypothetical protein